MSETRYIIKITPSDKEKRSWPCECDYMGRTGGCGSNLYLCETKEKLFNRAYKTYDGAEYGYKLQLGKSYSMPALESYEWWNSIKNLPKKERDRIVLEKYEEVKELYIAEIMTVDEAWKDWTNVFEKEHSLA